MILIVLAFLLVAALFWGLSIGTVKLPIDQIYNSVLEQLTGDLPIEAIGRGPVHDIVWLLRLPRLVLAALIGCGLAVCGVIMQAIVKNPLADPYILGISSGASLGATSAILLGIGASLGPNFIGISAFIGAFILSLAVLFISNLGGRSNSMKLLLAGMALSAVCSAFSSFIVYFANNKEGMQSIAYWLMGSLANVSYRDVLLCAAIEIPCLAVAMILRWKMNLLSLEQEEARSLGINVKKLRLAVILIATIMTAVTVSVCGIIGWIGLVIPHIARLLIENDHRMAQEDSIRNAYVATMMTDEQAKEWVNGLYGNILQPEKLPTYLS